jgi:hypothetical protein
MAKEFVVISAVILSDSEESNIIEILRRSAPQNDTVWTFYECLKLYSDALLFALSFSGLG